MKTIVKLVIDLEPGMAERMRAAIAARGETKRAFVERAIANELARAASTSAAPSPGGRR